MQKSFAHALTSEDTMNILVANSHKGVFMTPKVTDLYTGWMGGILGWVEGSRYVVRNECAVGAVDWIVLRWQTFIANPFNTRSSTQDSFEGIASKHGDFSCKDLHLLLMNTMEIWTEPYRCTELIY